MRQDDAIYDVGIRDGVGVIHMTDHADFGPSKLGIDSIMCHKNMGANGFFRIPELHLGAGLVAPRRE